MANAYPQGMQLLVRVSRTARLVYVRLIIETGSLIAMSVIVINSLIHNDATVLDLPYRDNTFELLEATVHEY